MRLPWLASIAGLAGCGLVSGLDDLSVSDGGVDATDEGLADVSIDIASSCESGSCGAPAGFQPVLFAMDRNNTCGGASASNDVAVDPIASSAACVCECAYQPVCLPQPFVYAGGSTCTQSTTTNITLDGGCNVGTGVPPPSKMSFGPYAPVNACTSTLASVGNVTTTAGRICGVTSCAACAPPTGFSLCFAQAGDQSCPDGMKKHTIGAAAQLSCSSCSACTSTATCKGTLKIYDDNACFDQVGSFTVDGTCDSALNVDDLGSMKYTSSVDPGTCVPGTSTPSVAISAETTVCCP